MKTILLGTVAAVTLGLVSQASAADLAARPYTKAPPMLAAVYDWTGFYIGGDAGYIEGRSRLTDINAYNGAAGSFGYRPRGFLGDGHIGYNWQTGAFVLGAEVEGGYMGLRGSAQFPPFVGVRLPTDSRAIARDGAYLAITGRAGFAANNWLFYGKGGYVTTDVRTTFIDTDPTGTTLGATTTRSRDGWTAGAGIEYGFAPNWTTRIEYNHYDFGNAVTTGISSGSGATFRFNQNVTADSGRIGINYRWGGPVVAKY